VHILRERNYQAYGCDFSSAAMSLTTSLAKPFVQLADIRRLPYEVGSFRSSSAFHVLEHLARKDVGGVINEVFRVTTERFYGIIPTINGVAMKDGEIKKRVLADPAHKTLERRQWWIDRFLEVGWVENLSLEQHFDRLGYGWVFVFDK
jgi:hypothetical protein